MLSYICRTAAAEETEAAGAALARRITAEDLPRYIALYGDLGVGKTAFVRGFAGVICPGAVVRSPTFALVHEHKGKPFDLFHFDMYRITGEDDLYSIGYDDYLSRGGFCLVEWSENIPFALPPHYLRVEIVKDDPANADSRRITVTQI